MSFVIRFPIWCRVASIVSTVTPMLLIWALVLNRVPKVISSFTCLDEAGKSIDWFIAFKIPKLEKEPYPFNTGLAYTYITSNDNNGRWIVGRSLVNETPSLLRRTLDQVYRNWQHYYYLQYNDHPPVGKGNSHAGHLKGMLAIDTKQSIWIQHSIPRFAAPFNSTEFQYPSNALQNGQHIVCVTLDTNRSVDQVLQQLLIMRPSIYASNHDPKYLKAHPAFDQLINRKFSKTDFKQLSMRTAGGMTFQHFAKSPRYRRELYVDLIAPALQINLTVQSWRNGAGGRLKSSCNSTFDVFNIEEVRIQGAAGVPHGASSSKPKPKLKPKRTAKRDVQALPLTSGGIVWKSTEDHSKWAAAEHGKRPIACLGDVNRMRSQFVRGGGAVCIQNAKMWRTISGSALETEPCPIH